VDALSRLGVVYVSLRRSAGSTRDRIVGAVRELLEQGAFHETTVEEVAARAGVSRATLYQHFGTRLGLVDAMCETFDANPALVALRDEDDVDRSTGVGAVPRVVAAQADAGDDLGREQHRDLVERQRRDRHGELRRLLRANGADDRATFARLALLTSFETYQELRRAVGLSKRDVVATIASLVRAA